MALDRGLAADGAVWALSHDGRRDALFRHLDGTVFAIVDAESDAAWDADTTSLNPVSVIASVAKQSRAGPRRPGSLRYARNDGIN